MKKKILALIAAFALLGFSSAFAKLDWMLDFDKAYEKAQKEYKPLMVLFTGSDWCPACMVLDKKILSTSEFEKYANENLILLYCDFPEKKTLEKAQLAHNEKLANAYGLKIYPTVLLIAKDKTKPQEMKFYNRKKFIEDIDAFKMKNFPLSAPKESAKTK